MSGGVAYVFDERGDFTEKRCNLESVDLEPVLEAQNVRLVEGRPGEGHFGEVKTKSKIWWYGISG